MCLEGRGGRGVGGGGGEEGVRRGVSPKGSKTSKWYLYIPMIAFTCTYTCLKLPSSTSTCIPVFSVYMRTLSHDLLTEHARIRY